MTAFKVSTNDRSNDSRLDINNAAVSGIVTSGNGYSQFEETMAEVRLRIPIFSGKFYAKIQDKVFSEREVTTVETMERAATIESKAAIPVVDVFVDGA
ncbi:unnamed protein product [Colias eurytheme]|nr:unnamed protein product [Colias eurytheme]